MLPVSFRNVSVSRPYHKHLLVRWSINPTAHDPRDLAYVIFRSQSEAGPFEERGRAEEGAFHFTDSELDAGDARLFFYVVRAVSKSGLGFVDSKSMTLEHQPDNIAMEMIRKKNVFLRAKSGIPLAVLQRKQWGPSCSRCWDPVRQAPRDADCPECFGTGFVGGYLAPVYVFGSLAPAEVDVIRVGLEYAADNSYVELANYPTLSWRDLIVDRVLNQRYKVERVKPAAHRMSIVTQIAAVTKIDEHSAEYDIEVKEPLGAQRGYSWMGDV